MRPSSWLKFKRPLVVTCLPNIIIVVVFYSLCYLIIAAGIPDFRSPGTGLYDNLQKYNLPSPQAIFEIGYFKQNPKPFFHLAKELYPALFKVSGYCNLIGSTKNITFHPQPTLCHYFIRLLAEEGLLLRNYTQVFKCLYWK